MLKILERCLKDDPKLCELYKLDQIIKSSSLPDLRTIIGKPIIS
jgi:hypothetical protein